MTTSRNSMSGTFQADPMKGPTAMHPVQKIIPKRMTSVVGPTQNFFMRESKTLGAVQIMNGLFHLALGGLLMIHTDVYAPICITLWYPFWGGVMYIISGSLLAAVDKNPRQSLAKGKMIMNSLSLFAAISGIIFLKLVTAGIVENEWKNLCSKPKSDVVVLLAAEEKKEQPIETTEDMMELTEVPSQPKNEEEIEIIPVQEEEEEMEINFQELPQDQEPSPIENDSIP
ncbi:B-lymphocyte antigen CD20 isoform X4 [Lontra canadensis]|uniref:B-lymphocyte antigen CD20 isoform X4 n=1 Tax=Lontra canadensis TaxID=76717 RepID=UPI0013F2B633|nr:B-lymphocyte antigen CD20 isoform X4 [Lontra canadensis]